MVEIVLVRKKSRLCEAEVGRPRRSDMVPPQLTDASPDKLLEIDVILEAVVIKWNS